MKTEGLRRPAFLSLAALALYLLSRAPFFPAYPISFDALNYMRALERMDVRLHQPQPPGYPLYILLGRVFLWVTGDPHRALLWLSALAGLLAGWALYALGKRLYGQRAGLLAAIFLLSAPAVWFQSEIAAPYTLDLLASIGIGLLAWETMEGKEKAAPWMLAAALGLSGAFRPQTMVFLAPLAAFALWKRGLRSLLGGGLLAAAVFVLGFAPIVTASGGWEGYRAALGHLTEIPAWGQARLDGGSRLLRNALTVLRLTFGAMSEPLWLLALVGIADDGQRSGGRRQGSVVSRQSSAVSGQRSGVSRPPSIVHRLPSTVHRPPSIVYLLWLLPSWVVYVLLWPGNRGTILVSMAPFYLLAARGAEGIIRRRPALGWSLAGAVVLWQVLLFAFLPQQPFGEAWRRYDNAETLRWKEAYYRNRLETVADLPAEGTLVYAVEFRHLQTYLPQYRTFSPPIFDPQGSGRVVSIIEIRDGEQIVHRDPALETLVPPGTRRILLFDLPAEALHAPPEWVQSLPVPDAPPMSLLTLPANARTRWQADGIWAEIPASTSSLSAPGDLTLLLDTPAARPVPPAYGINGWWSDEDAAILTARYAELAPQVVRLPLLAAVIEPDNDNADPHAFEQPFDAGGRHLTYARWFAALRDLGAEVMLYVPYLPEWMAKRPGPTPLTAPYPPADLEEYAELLRVTLRYLVEEIGYPPERIILEPVNEPDLQCGSDPAVACFWRNGDFESLTAVIQVAHREAKAVSPQIRIAGLTTCCTHAMLDRFMESPERAALLDIITYHDYTGGYSIGRALDTGKHLRAYGKPVYLDEYGSTTYWSDGQDGALWHAAVLPQLWAHGLAPIQFSLSEWPGMHAGYNQLGLMSDWNANWQVKPAYYVYRNFYAAIPGAQPVEVRAPEGVIAWAGRNPQSGAVLLWLVNGTWEEKGGELTLEVRGWPEDSALVRVQNPLQAPAEGGTTFRVAAAPEGGLVFKVALPPRSAALVTLTAGR